MYYFIINPSSGSGRGLSVWKTVKKELERLGVIYKSFLLSRGGEAYSLATGIAESKNPATVVVVGGDGTINEVVSGLHSFQNITFGCIPTGSGNDFVRGLGLHLDPIEALHAILHPSKICPVNIGNISHSGPLGLRSYSYGVSAGIGYDAAVWYSILDSKLKTLLNRFHSGKLVYLLTALWQLFTMKRQTLQITLDGDKTELFEEAYFAAAMNLPYEGGGFMFCPDARFDDDQIDLIIASGISRLEALKLLPLALFGKHVGHKGIHIIRCHQAAIHVSPAMCVHTDGEVPGFFEEVTFSLREEKLPVILR